MMVKDQILECVDWKIEPLRDFVKRSSRSFISHSAPALIAVHTDLLGRVYVANAKKVIALPEEANSRLNQIHLINSKFCGETPLGVRAHLVEEVLLAITNLTQENEKRFLRNKPQILSRRAKLKP